MPRASVAAVAVVVSAGVSIYVVAKSLWGKTKCRRDAQEEEQELGELNVIVDGNRIGIPAMFVDLDAFDGNVRTLANVVKMHDNTGKTIRLATKSVRVMDLLVRAYELGLKEYGGIFKGWMCFSVKEAQYLAMKAPTVFNDIVVAYPTVQRDDLDGMLELRKKGVAISLMVDCDAQLEVLSGYWQSYGIKGQKLNVWIDLDVSWRPFNGMIHLGAHRSPVRSAQECLRLAQIIQKSQWLHLDGIMGYEAHIAGLPDDDPFSEHPNFLIRILKSWFNSSCHQLRKSTQQLLKANNIECRVINGGGTGSLKETCKDNSLTEVTFGSGLLQSKLFDYYVSNACKPALFFGLQVTRKPEKDIVVCQSGGFIASGWVSQDKMPVPYRPCDLSSLPGEGFGEVQTPLQGAAASKLSIGSTVFFRPAKAGEIAEHFREYHCLTRQQGKLQLVQTVKTYRGDGQAFY